MTSRPELSDVVTCDVLVLGGGGAALRAAVEAAEQGARVCQVVRGRRLGIGGATSFGVAETAGYAIPDGAAGDGDNTERFYQEVVEAGQGCAIEALARTVAEDAIPASELLREHGLAFMRDETDAELIARGDFATLSRNRKILGHGRPIAELLARLVTAHAGIRVLTSSVAVELLTEAGRVHGAVVQDGHGRCVVVDAGATVLATGGAGQLFEHSLMPPDICGGGYALAAKAGAEMVNMEFVQAGFGTLRPALHMVMPWYWRTGVRLLDAEGEEVLALAATQGMDHDDINERKRRHYPFSVSDPSGQLEIAAKRALAARPLTERGALLMRLPSEAPDSDPHGFWAVTRQALGRKGFAVDGGDIEVGLFGHSVNGGVAIDVDGRATVAGLYAAGEVTGGAYGADRLGGTMLLACQVFGRRAGRAAAKGAGGGRHPCIRALAREVVDRSRAIRHGQSGAPVAFLLNELRRTMSTHVLVSRTEQSLKTAANYLDEIADLLDNGGVCTSTPAERVAAVDLSSLVTTGRLMVHAARVRRESRGAHFRADYPNLDPALARPLHLRLDIAGRNIRTAHDEETHL